MAMVVDEVMSVAAARYCQHVMLGQTGSKKSGSCDQNLSAPTLDGGRCATVGAHRHAGATTAPLASRTDGRDTSMEHTGMVRRDPRSWQAVHMAHSPPVGPSVGKHGMPPFAGLGDPYARSGRATHTTPPLRAEERPRRAPCTLWHVPRRHGRRHHHACMAKGVEGHAHEGVGSVHHIYTQGARTIFAARSRFYASGRARDHHGLALGIRYRARLSFRQPVEAVRLVLVDQGGVNRIIEACEWVHSPYAYHGQVCPTHQHQIRTALAKLREV